MAAVPGTSQIAVNAEGRTFSISGLTKGQIEDMIIALGIARYRGQHNTPDFAARLEDLETELALAQAQAQSEI